MASENLVGQTLGQYELRELLGAGGMGAVYRGYQANLRREVAVKVLPGLLAKDSDYIKRFNREAEISASLEHTHIVPIHDYGMQRNISYVVMRLLTGGSLADRLRESAEDGRPLPSMAEISALLAQLASALDYAHDRGVVHRDIKPGNVMFDNQGNAYVVDFGIARLVNEATSLTGTGMVIGTMSYLAPELWSGQPASAASDQYALAVMVYEMLTGRRPFDATTPVHMMHKHLNELPTPPQAYRSDAPKAVALVLDRALAKDPTQRFSTITAFAQAFDSAIAGAPQETTGLLPRMQKARRSGNTPLSPPSYAPPPRPSRRNPILIGTFMTLLIIAVLALAATMFTQQANINATLTAMAIVAAPSMTATPTQPPSDTLAPVVVLVTSTETPNATATAHDTPEPSHTPRQVASAAPTTTEAPTVMPSLTSTETKEPSEPPTLMIVIVPTDQQSATASSTATSTASPSPTNTPSRISTHTPVPTLAPTATTTYTPSATRTNTPTPPPTKALTPTATDTPILTATDSKVMLTARGSVAVHKIDYLFSETIETLSPGHSEVAIGTDDLGWYLVEVNGKQGWVFGQLVEVRGDITSLPRITPTATLTPTGVPKVVPQASRTLGVQVNDQDGPSGVVENLAPGETAIILQCSARTGWWKVQLDDGTQGWVSNDVVNVLGDASQIPCVAPPTLTPSKTATISAPTFTSRGSITIRSRDSLLSPSTGTLAPGTTVVIIGISGNDSDWYQIRVNGKDGWVLHQFGNVNGNVAFLPRKTPPTTTPTRTATATRSPTPTPTATIRPRPTNTLRPTEDLVATRVKELLMTQTFEAGVVARVEDLLATASAPARP